MRQKGFLSPHNPVFFAPGRGISAAHKSGVMPEWLKGLPC